ncbi:RUN domain-containing protein 3B-like [Dysidea avara]|uniref:RUN domain-containing protein 3B-like n=1 Tax=Dysidea avara TaxID=196820 RepID=UPI0033242C8F
MAYSESSHAEKQISIKRKNLLNIARMVIKTLVDKSAFNPVEDDDEDLQNFCIVMEHILSHRLQVQWSSTWFSSSNEPFHYWDIVKKFDHPNTLQSIDDMSDEVQTSEGKGRVWLRLVLVQKKLLHFFDKVLAKQSKLGLYYQPLAFMLSEEATILSENLRCLNAIDFNLCLRGGNFDHGIYFEIDYTPYLNFEQCQSSKEDDLMEDKKLDSSILMEEITLTHPSPGEELVQLRELLKTEKEQKNYFEELVSVRDGQLSQLQTQLKTLTKEGESQRRQLEAIILELQQQLIQMQQEVGKERRRVENYLLHANSDDQNT